MKNSKQLWKHAHCMACFHVSLPQWELGKMFAISDKYCEVNIKWFMSILTASIQDITLTGINSDYQGCQKVSLKTA